MTSDNQTNEKAIHCTGCKKIHRGQDVLEKVETGYAGVGTAFKCSECDYTNVKLCESKSKEVNNVKVEFALVETASCSKCKTEFAVKVIKDEVAGFKNILIKK